MEQEDPEDRGNVAPVKKAADSLDDLEEPCAPARELPSFERASERERALWELGLGRGVILQYWRSNLPPVSLDAYLNHTITGPSLDAQRFRAIRENSSETANYSEQNSREGALRARWDHWGQRGAGDNLTTWPSCDIPVVRMDEEVAYERRLAAMLARFADDESSRPTAVHLELVCLDYAYDELWFVDGRKLRHFARDINFETRLREFGKLCGVFASWHCVEVFTLRPGQRASLYVPVDATWRSLEHGRLLLLPSPPCFAYASSQILGQTNLSASLQLVAYSEAGVMILLRFLALARYGKDQCYTRCRGLRDGDGLLVPLRADARDLIEMLGFFAIVGRTSHDPFLARMAFVRSHEVDWHRDAAKERWASYDWTLGSVYSPYWDPARQLNYAGIQRHHDEWLAGQEAVNASGTADVGMGQSVDDGLSVVRVPSVEVRPIDAPEGSSGADLATVRNSLADAGRRCDQAVAAKAELERRMSSLVIESDARQAEVFQLRAEVSRVKGELATARASPAVRDLERQLIHARAAAGSSKEMESIAVTASRRAAAERKEIELQLHAAITERDQMKGMVVSAGQGREALTRERNDALRELAALRELLDTSVDEVASLRGQLDASTAELETARGDAEKARASANDSLGRKLRIRAARLAAGALNRETRSLSVLTDKARELSEACAELETGIRLTQCAVARGGSGVLAKLGPPSSSEENEDTDTGEPREGEVHVSDVAAEVVAPSADDKADGDYRPRSLKRRRVAQKAPRPSRAHR